MWVLLTVSIETAARTEDYRMATSTGSVIDLSNAQQLLDDTAPAQLQVVSTPPLKLADTQMMVKWSRRSTEKNPVADTERYRGVCIDKKVLAIPHDACHSPYYALLQSTIHELADGAFTAWVKENMHSVKMDAARLSIDAVLAFWAEKKESETIDAAAIVEFLKASATCKAFSAEKKAAWLQRVPKIAAPAYKNIFSKKDAAAIAAQIVDADLEHPAALFIVQRANNILTTESIAASLE